VRIGIGLFISVSKIDSGSALVGLPGCFLYGAALAGDGMPTDEGTVDIDRPVTKPANEGTCGTSVRRRFGCWSTAIPNVPTANPRTSAPEFPYPSTGNRVTSAISAD
jgi:hypothetical protein